jgi:3-oxoisoapionate decarboxylase
MKLGVDIYSLRFNQWNVFQHLDYAQQIGLQVVHFSDMSPFENFSDEYLARVKQYADDRQLQIEAGMGSICPTSNTFKEQLGPASEQLSNMLHIAAKLGSPALRCYLGSSADRHSELPLSAHIEATIATCHEVRSVAVDLNVKIAIENHAGDLQGHELRTLIETAGPDYVGACIDSGNPLWTIEDPLVTLEHLAPYVQMCHVRDTVVAPHPDGATAQWVAMGEGNVGMDHWINLFCRQCPDVPLTLEIITTIPPRILPYLHAEFWKGYPNASALEFARFLRLAAHGKPYTLPAFTIDQRVPSTVMRAALAEEQRSQLEQSVAYIKKSITTTYP